MYDYISEFGIFNHAANSDAALILIQEIEKEANLELETACISVGGRAPLKPAFQLDDL